MGERALRASDLERKRVSHRGPNRDTYTVKYNDYRPLAEEVTAWDLGAHVQRGLRESIDAA